jgi:hypothetical protein
MPGTVPPDRGPVETTNQRSNLQDSLKISQVTLCTLIYTTFSHFAHTDSAHPNVVEYSECMHSCYTMSPPLSGRFLRSIDYVRHFTGYICYAIVPLIKGFKN